MIAISLSQSLSLIKKLSIDMKVILKGENLMEKVLKNTLMAVNTEGSLKTEKKVAMDITIGPMGPNMKGTLLTI